MKKKALISIKSRQNNDDSDVIEVVTPGDFFKKDDKYYVIYEETEISGMQGTTTTLKIKDKQLTLSRKGTTNTKMVFEKNKKEVVMYGTPHGMLEFLIDTRGLNIDINDNGGKIVANYNMVVTGGGDSLKTALEVSINPQEKEWS